MNEPVYVHNCEDCVYLGVAYREHSGSPVDLYDCPEQNTVIARLSSKGSDYLSGRGTVHPLLVEAERRADLTKRRQWVTVVYMQGEEAEQVIDRLCHWEAPGSYRGTTAESIDAAIEYLAQWDTGEEVEHTLYSEPPWGRWDNVAEGPGDSKTYTLTWSFEGPHVSLNRIIEVATDDGTSRDDAPERG